MEPFVSETEFTTPITNSDLGAQQDIKYQRVLRNKSDGFHKLAVSTPVLKPAVHADDVECLLISKHEKNARELVKKPKKETVNSTCKRLLADIIAVFRARNISKIRSKSLLVQLCADKKKPWATFCHGNNLHFQRLSALLREFGIHSKDMRFKNRSFKGYQKEWFVDVAKRQIGRAHV